MNFDIFYRAKILCKDENQSACYFFVVWYKSHVICWCFFLRKQGITLRPREGSSKVTGSNWRLIFQWSILLLPCMTKNRVFAFWSSATNQYEEEMACLWVTWLWPQVVSKAAVTVAIVAKAVLQNQHVIYYWIFGISLWDRVHIIMGA